MLENKSKHRMITVLCSFRLSLCATFLVITGSLLQAGPYDAQPLRANLGIEPYFHTELGRENKRFVERDINRYRLFDFYRRQADHYLTNPTISDTLLPPYPGLDGGRRGHWGSTNEKNTTALARAVEAEFPTLTSRGPQSIYYIRSGSSDHPAVIIYDSLKPAVQSVVHEAHMKVPDHYFGTKVDRFGMAIEILGKSTTESPQALWLDAQKKAPRLSGYTLSGNHALLHLGFDNDSTISEWPHVILSPSDHHTTLQRDYLFTNPAKQSLHYQLPDIENAEIILHNAQQLCYRKKSTQGTRLHCIRWTSDLAEKIKKETDSLTLTDPTIASRISHFSTEELTENPNFATTWLRETQEQFDRAEMTILAQQHTPQYPITSTTTATLNADPEAAKSAYQIDDIAIPYDNPYECSMTLSGIAFAKDGTAFVCTLVGDVWKVTGLRGDMKSVTWKRYAAGLNLPLGIIIVDGHPCVSVRRNLIRLRDLNGDDEADSYEYINQMDLPTGTENGRDVRCDAKGNFLVNTYGGIYRLSADGKTIEQIGNGSRNPLGIGARPDGLVFSDSSEGNLNNGTCTIYESVHAENAQSKAHLRRILYLPRGIDNSPGSRLFPTNERFGPLAQSMLGTSFGSGTWYAVLRDVVEGTAQAAIIPMPGMFSSGASRLAQNPIDGQVYVVGLDGWGDYGESEGCFHRIRYTGAATTVVTSWRAHRNGILLDFSEPLQTAPAISDIFCQQWNYVDSYHTYGSPEYSVREPNNIGHDRLHVPSVHLSQDRKSLFVHIPDLRPAMCTQLRILGKSSIPLDFYCTIQQLAADHPDAAASSIEKPLTLQIIQRENNGDTHQQLLEYFDKRAGRDVIKRPVGEAVVYQKDQLRYAWIHENLIAKNCIICHGAGSQHDFSSYEKLSRVINRSEIEKSPILGMLQTNSMPPFPLPTIHPTLKQALHDWLQLGAPE